MKRLLAILLAFLTVFACVSCAGTGTDEQTSEISSVEETGDIAGPAEKKLKVFDADGVYYTLCREDNASSALKKSFATLGKRFSSYFDKEVKVDTDFTPGWQDIDNSRAEILVGKTNRAATQEFWDRLPENSYGYTVTDDKIVILGKNDTLTAYAVNAFDSDILLPLARKTDTLEIEVGTEKIVEYTGDTTTPSGLLKTGLPVLATLRDKVMIGVSEDFKVAQGAASDGKYWYAALKKKVNDVETDVIVKVDMATGERVAVGPELPLDHCNDMCYNPVKNLLLVPNMVGKRLTLIDPETLEVKESFLAEKLPGTPYATSYNKKLNCYVILAGGKVNFVDCDEFSVIRSFPMISMNYTGQGVDSDDDFVYIPMSKKPDAGTNDNVIVVYRIDDGEVAAQIHISDPIEIETMINIDGVYYAHFNSSGSSIYRVEFAAYVS